MWMLNFSVLVKPGTRSAVGIRCGGSGSSPEGISVLLNVRAWGSRWRETMGKAFGERMNDILLFGKSSCGKEWVSCH
ncbi:hypothetical protein M3J09_010233 [Ascochyta lentis]